MKRGFVFTLDAFFALIAIIILTGLLIFNYQAQEGSDYAFESTKISLRDEAIVNLYFGDDGDNPADYLGDEHVCIPYYIYPYCEVCSVGHWACEEIP